MACPLEDNYDCDGEERLMNEPLRALSVARAYHQGWTTRNIGEAARCLAPSLTVEVPINEYPTPDSFLRAVESFGALARDVRLLAEFGDADGAMLLYDMDVPPLGTLRIAEHFTVVEGKITRIRQIHDTAPIRAAGLGGE
jgi:hypothetical protein